MDETNRLSNDDLAVLERARTKVQLAVAHAEKMASDARVADLEYQSLVQQLFIKYGLKLTDTIDANTGLITVAEINEHPEKKETKEETSQLPPPKGGGLKEDT